jgi:hypothetical protein
MRGEKNVVIPPLVVLEKIALPSLNIELEPHEKPCERYG